MTAITLNVDQITKVEANGGGSVSVTLEGVSETEVVGEFSYVDLLDEMEFSDIVDYVAEKKAEMEEDGE